MDFSRVDRGEIIAALGGILLAISVFVKWYEARPENPNANINGELGTLSAWQAHGTLRFVLLLAAIAPIVLVYIIARDHELSWPRGEMTAVIAIAAIGLVFYFGIIDRPGEPSGEIELEIGWYGAMLGTILMLAGSFMRSSESAGPRKPPGTL